MAPDDFEQALYDALVRSMDDALQEPVCPLWQPALPVAWRRRVGSQRHGGRCPRDARTLSSIIGQEGALSVAPWPSSTQAALGAAVQRYLESDLCLGRQSAPLSSRPVGMPWTGARGYLRPRLPFPARLP